MVSEDRAQPRGKGEQPSIGGGSFIYFGKHTAAAALKFAACSPSPQARVLGRGGTFPLAAQALTRRI